MSDMTNRSELVRHCENACVPYKGEAAVNEYRNVFGPEALLRLELDLRNRAGRGIRPREERA